MIGSKLEYFRRLKNLTPPQNLIKTLLPVRVVLGVFLIMFGFIGIIMPGLPGWTPLILGVMIISPKHGKILAAWVYSIYKKYIVKFLSKLLYKH